MLNAKNIVQNVKKNIEEIMKPFRDMYKVNEPIRQLQQEIVKAMEPIREFQRAVDRMSTIYDSIPKFENQFAEVLENFKLIGVALKKHAENTPKYLLIIARHGWFMELDTEITFPSKIASLIEEGDIEQANKLLSEYYSSNIYRIFSELQERHPKRANILSQIYEGYKEKKYSLIIPTMLSQIDGTCYDFTKRKFFIKEKENKYLPEISSEIEKSADSFLGLYLSPIQNQTPILANEKDLDKYPCRLNRHEIIHGINANYGNKNNTLKVISLYKYISDLLIEVEISTKHNSK